MVKCIIYIFEYCYEVCIFEVFLLCVVLYFFYGRIKFIVNSKFLINCFEINVYIVFGFRLVFMMLG